MLLPYLTLSFSVFPLPLRESQLSTARKTLHVLISASFPRCNISVRSLHPSNSTVWQERVHPELIVKEPPTPASSGLCTWSWFFPPLGDDLLLT